MRYYLFSSSPCAASLNGEYLAVADGNLCYFDCSNKSTLVLSPLCDTLSPLTLSLQNPPKKQENVQLIDLYGDFLIIPTFKKQPTSRYEVLFDKRFDDNNLRVSAFCFGCEKVLIENEFGHAYAPICSFNPSSQFFTHMVNGKLLISITSKSEDSLLIFDVANKPKLLFEGVGKIIKRTQEQITLCQNLNLIAVDKLFCTVNLTDLGVQSNFRQRLSPAQIHPSLIACAFLQAVQYRFDFAQFLHPDIAKNKQFVPDFLGEFSAIVPLPPATGERQFAVLIGKNARVVELFIADMSICNLSIL